MKLRLSRPVKIGIELLLLGLLIFLFVEVLDFRRVQAYVRLITLRVFFGVLGFQFAILLIQTLQWGLVLREAGIFRGVWWTFRSRVSGSALTYLTPSMYFGGEPVRAGMYKNSMMTYQKVYATIALDKYIELAGKIPCIIVGFSVLVYFVHRGTLLIIVSGTFLVAFIGFFIFLIAKLFSSETFIVTFFKRVLRLIARINPRTAVKLLKSIREFALDVHTLMGRRKIFYAAMAAGVSVAVVEVLQTFFILDVLGRASLADSFVIFATVVIQGLIGILPGNIGGMEGTHLFIFNVLSIGSDPSIVYTMILRMGQMTMVLMGLLSIFAWRIGRAGVRGADRNRTDA